jgi:ubiquinone/menaquinone biosynthesis C-methylase UbiE
MKFSDFIRRLSRRRQAQILDRMRRDWDQRAKENARHYVATLQDDWTDEQFFESGAIWIRYHIEPTLAAICNGRPASDLSVLEIGCGAGRMTLPLSKIFGRVEAVDISPEMIAQARSALRGAANVGLHVNNGADLSMFPHEHFDFVFSAIVFQHIPSRAIVENYVREAWRVLKPQSLFKFQVQGAPFDDKYADTWLGLSFTERQMRDVAERCRFEVTGVQGAGTQEFWLTFRKEL